MFDSRLLLQKYGDILTKGSIVILFFQILPFGHHKKHRRHKHSRNDDSVAGTSGWGDTLAESASNQPAIKLKIKIGGQAVGATR
jgi:hypothetical protein